MKTVAPRLSDFSLVYDERGELVAVVEPTPERRPERGTRWLASVLGVTRQRASKLLNAGRIAGAVRDSVTGAWDLSGVSVPQVTPGKRGPALGGGTMARRKASARASGAEVQQQGEAVQRDLREREQRKRRAQARSVWVDRTSAPEDRRR